MATAVAELVCFGSLLPKPGHTVPPVPCTAHTLTNYPLTTAPLAGYTVRSVGL